MQLVERIAPNATFRLANDHYIGDNDIAHVHFWQTVDGVDIDNAVLSVNVGVRPKLELYLPFGGLHTNSS
jgi:extracellular elastinolytic metalloproteinase